MNKSYTRKMKKLIIVILLLSSLASLSITPQRVKTLAKAHPLILEEARSNPSQPLRVIIQKATQSDRVNHTAKDLGAKILFDLPIINAFVAEMSAQSALELSYANGVKWISPDGKVNSTSKKVKHRSEETLQPNFYHQSLGLDVTQALEVDGENVTVAIIDSGIFMDRDFTTVPGRPFTRIIQQVSFNGKRVVDNMGHGTHIAGIVGGNGYASDGLYAGIAPGVNLINLKISDKNGMAYESDTVAALQWVYENKDAYNIRVVNLSIQSEIPQSYHVSPLDAAVEILWFNSVVVVAASGNWNDAGFNQVDAPPANDPFIITVGAMDENDDGDRSNDLVASFSAFGTTLDGFTKPEIYAPGVDIISVLSRSSDWGRIYPDRVVMRGEYFRLSGTSMAAPMVTGAVALLLQSEPQLNPDQVKYRLIHTGTPTNGGTYLHIGAALTTFTNETANTGLPASQLLWTGTDPINWGSVNWGSVNWGSVNWGSVNWGSVNWGSVNWGSVNWGSVSWED